MRKVKVAYVAPGQGVEEFSDGLYLAHEFPEIVLPVYEEIFDVTGVNILDVADGLAPSDDISVIQPAVLGIGVAHAKVLKEHEVNPDYLIGFSAGEFTVAAISGALKLSDAARYVQRRSEEQMRVAGGKGGVLTVRHRGNLDVDSLLQGLDGVWHTGFHSKKLSGFSFRNASRSALVKRLDEIGARIIDTTVPFAAHSPDVLEAQKTLDSIIEEEAVNDAKISIISIRIAKAMRKASIIRNNIIWQTTEPTRMEEAINYAVENGVEEFYPLAPGDSMAKMTASNVDSASVRIHGLESLAA